MSLVLRHDPRRIGLDLDTAGWTTLAELIAKSSAHGQQLSEALIREVVATSDKQRFALSEDGLSIRANQGHSIHVELGLAACEPPPVLFHGTARRFLDSIRATGLEKRSRQHVHLSADEDTAAKVGARHGKVVILRVDAAGMTAAGHLFWRADNGVWLTEAVPAVFLGFPDA